MAAFEDRLELMQLLERQLHDRAKSSYADYVRVTMDFEPALHHQLLIHELERVEAGELDVLIVSMPPGSAKSTYASVGFPAWYLGRNPQKCVICASNTGELAERFGRRARGLVGSTEHRAIFPESELSAESAAAGRWETTKGGEYFAAGVGGTITGRRGDLILIDDPVKSREEADSETIREKQWAWFRDDLQTRLKPGGAIIIIMTRWHEDDLAGRLLEDIKKHPGQRVKVLKLAMEAGEDDPLGRQPGETLWPEWFTPEMVAIAKREPRTWSALYQQEPRPIGGGEFKKDWLNYWSRPPAVGQKILLVDPSSGISKTRGDFTSMWVVGVGPDGNDYVVDGVRDRLNLTERTEKLFELVRRHKPACVGYERYGLQSDIEHIKQEQERQQYRFRVMELGGAMKKEDRIRRLIPSFQQGRTWMPQSMIRTMSDGHQRDIMEDFLAEYVAFPVSSHDDAMDCLARKEEPEMRKWLTQPAQPKLMPVVSYGVLDESSGY